MTVRKATLSCAVMAHPARGDQVAELLDALDRDVPVAWDAKPPSSDAEQRWKVGHRAWMLHDPTAEWHVVAQDDVQPCENMLDGLQEALAHVPEKTAVSGYLGTKRPKGELHARLAAEAQRVGASWVELDGLHWGQAICLPVSLIGRMLAWCDRRHGAPYDTRISKFVTRVAGWRVWATWPSLVDHREGPSLWGAFDPEGRHAHQVVAGSALDVDWSGPIVTHQRRVSMRSMGHDPFAPHKRRRSPVHRVQAPALQGVAPADAEEVTTPQVHLDPVEHLDVDEPLPEPDFSALAPTEAAPEPVSKPTTRDSAAAWRAYGAAMGVEGADTMTKAQLVNHFKDDAG